MTVKGWVDVRKALTELSRYGDRTVNLTIKFVNGDPIVVSVTPVFGNSVEEFAAMFRMWDGKSEVVPDGKGGEK